MEGLLEPSYQSYKRYNANIIALDYVKIGSILSQVS